MKIQIHSEYENESIVYNHATKQEQRPEDYFVHYHDVTELIFIKSGEMSYSVGDKAYLLQKNNLVLTRPGDSHLIQVTGNNEYERYNILFDDKKLPFELFGYLQTDLHVIGFDANKMVVGIFEKMDYYCQNLEGEELGRLLYNLLCEILIHVLLFAKQLKDERACGLTPTVTAALAYIEENLLTLEHIDELCMALYISKSHLHHVFMQQLGISPKKYIADKRLERARRELSLGVKATDIYGSFGYGDYSSFYRAYKKKYGCSPAETPRTDCTRIAFSDFLKGYKM